MTWFHMGSNVTHMETIDAGTARRKYEFLGINLPRTIKKQVRTVAAEMEGTLNAAATELIKLGLEAYLRGEHLDTEAGQAKETAEGIEALKEGRL